MAARHKCIEKQGELATPSAGAFSGYLGRLFKRESFKHITQDNFIQNLDFVREEIDKDIRENRASTGRVAEFISLTLGEVIEQSKFTQTQRSLSEHGPK